MQAIFSRRLRIVAFIVHVCASCLNTGKLLYYCSSNATTVVVHVVVAAAAVAMVVIETMYCNYMLKPDTHYTFERAVCTGRTNIHCYYHYYYY